MSEYQSDPVRQRLDRLERENWYWKRATLLLLLVIGTAILIGQKQTRPEPEVTKATMIEAGKVKTQKLEIIDEEGKTRAEIYYQKERATGGTVVFEMNAKNTSTKAGLYVDDKGVGLFFVTPPKKPDPDHPNVEVKILLGASSDEGAHLTLYDSQGDTDIALAGQNGLLRAVLGKTRLAIPATASVEERSAASLVFFNKDRKVIWKAP